MTLKMIGTATAVVALSTSVALADCKEDLAAFGERYHGMQSLDQRVDRATSRTLRDLRTAANRLAASGNEEGCAAIVEAMTEVADEADSAMEKVESEVKEETKEMKAEAKEAGEKVEKTAEEAGEKVEKTAEATGEKVESAAEAAARSVEEAAAALRERLVNLTETDITFDTSDLKGYNVYNLGNEFLGEIDGMLTRAGNAPTHMIVGHGGFLNIGDKEAAIPLSAMMWDPAEEVFYVNMTEEQLENAPDYDKVDGKWVPDQNDAYYQGVDEQNMKAQEPKKE